ncbi:MAG: hypothetical protein EOP52_04320 [Sphingobacteriales bacterium]|nr:MAG: hypothetical protein EOP52_04320 [Sphingobacteriales bacterium]
MRIRLLLLLLAVTFRSLGQSSYPQTLFRNPLAIPIQLAGNFGECRPAHFHSGIDIKTDGVENKPVYAAAGGYISRISLKPGGFGHCLYVTHPEGYTTVYAHLNDFVKPLQTFIRAAQYRNEAWELDTALPATFFPVRKGQQIAFSGNTGGSTAPHLHFEIRNTRTERPLNPQLFGLMPQDHRAPVLRNLYLYHLDGSLYETTPRKIAFRKVGDRYRPAGSDTVTVDAQQIGIGIDGDDYADGSENTLAPVRTSLSVAGQLVCDITLDDIGYDETKYLNAYADYSTKQKGGPWVQLMFRSPGNGLTRIYDATADGVFSVGTQPVRVEGFWEDAAGLRSSYSFWVKGKNSKQLPCTPGFKTGQPMRYQNTNLRLQASGTALYDDVCEGIDVTPKAGAFSDAFRIGRADIPLHTALTLWIKPNRPIPFELRSKLVAFYSDGKKTSGTQAGVDSERWYQFSGKSFGTYWLGCDTTKPVIKPSGKTATSIRFDVTDLNTSVAAVRGTIDGRWVLFEQHYDSWTYVFDDRLPTGTHTLILTATDAIGNQAVYKAQVMR